MLVEPHIDRVQQLISDGYLTEALLFLDSATQGSSDARIQALRQEMALHRHRLAAHHRAESVGESGHDEAARRLTFIASGIAEYATEIIAILPNAALQQANLLSIAEDLRLVECDGPPPMAQFNKPDGAFCFISYARPDEHKLVALTTAISQRGISAWTDQSLRGGSRYADEIVQRIDAAVAVLVLWTPASVRSDWVRYEARRAHQQNKHIPLRVSALDVEELPPPYAAVLNVIAADEHDKIAEALAQYR